MIPSFLILIEVPIRIAGIDGIISGIGIAVEVDAGEFGVPCVGRGEPSEQRVVVAGMQVDEPGFGVVPFR